MSALEATCKLPLCACCLLTWNPLGPGSTDGTHTQTQNETGESCIYTKIDRYIWQIQVHTETQVSASSTVTVAHVLTYLQFAQTKAQTVLVISAPSESICWIECLEVFQLTDGTGILNSALQETGYITQGVHNTRINKKNIGYCSRTKTYTYTHMHAITHAHRKTDIAVHFNNLYSTCFNCFFMWIFECRAGNQTSYNRIDVEPGLQALAIEIPFTM